MTLLAIKKKQEAEREQKARLETSDPFSLNATSMTCHIVETSYLGEGFAELK